MTTTMTIKHEVESLLTHLGVPSAAYSGGSLTVRTPITGEIIANVPTIAAADATKTIAQAHTAFLEWRNVPAPKRGELIRLLGEELRTELPTLGRLVTIETGKILSEGHGEVQEMIDICDFAVGLSRQLYGLTIASERPHHRMMEQWQPLGIAGIITAFNFPVAVWSWNAIIAAVCGDVCIWKASEKTPLCAVAIHNIIAEVLRHNALPEGIFSLVNGDYRIGSKLAADSRVALISATGSVRMGKQLAPVVAERLGKSILELGGNNAVIVTQSAEQDMALRAMVFGAAGTAGQRCTTTRRLILHESIYD